MSQNENRKLQHRNHNRLEYIRKSNEMKLPRKVEYNKLN